MKESLKAQLVLNFLEVAFHFSPKRQGAIPSNASQLKALCLTKGIPLKNLRFCSLRQNPDKGKANKMHQL